MIKQTNGNLNHKDLYVSNMIVTGQIKLKHMFTINEGNKLMNKFNYMWFNEEISPVLSKVVEIRKNPEIKRGKPKQPYVSLWANGKINIVGVLSLKEANQVYDIVLSEVKKTFPKKVEES
jgi:hypothetical protein